jgi:short-subunit dehydrogenase
MTQLKNATVLLTGASGGFGQEFIKQLVEAGSRLILTDIDEKAIAKILETLNISLTDQIIAILEANLTSSAGCEHLYQQVQALNQPIDILINNAGIALFGRIDEVPTEKWEQLMELNLLTPMRLTTRFLPEMIARKKGHIVNISSVAGWSAPGGLTHYATSKFGLRGFSEGLRDELKPYDIKVTAVYPYFSRTPILRSPRYGTLAEMVPGFPESQATNPEMVIANVLQGIIKNQAQVFPDPTAKAIHIIKRYSPPLLDWLTQQLTRKISQSSAHSE